MERQKDITYVVASKLGTIGMGSTAYNALRGIESARLNYKCFSRGYIPHIALNKNNLSDYSWLECLSYPFRFIEKYLKIKINSFKFVNYLFGKLISLNLPKTKIYHSWIGISPDAVRRAKENGAILVLEGANSHPMNCLDILSKEYSNFKVKMTVAEKDSFYTQSKLSKQFNYVICPSKFVHDSFLKYGFFEKQLIDIPYGVDINKFKPNKSKVNHPLRFIFVGSVQLRKGVQYLLKAWQELGLKDSELLIVGRVWPDANEVVKEYKHISSIKFIGFDANPARILHSSDVFISPSLEEGSALTCYEAMASGLPVIATHNTGSVVRDGKDGFIIPIRNIREIKQKILYFYENRSKINEMGHNARENMKNYTWEEYGRRLSRFYKKILDNNKKTHE